MKRGVDGLAVLGATAIVFVIASLFAAGLNRIHFSSGPVSHMPVPHETDRLSSGLIPNRLRVARREFHGTQLNIDADGWRTGRPTGRLFDDWQPDANNVFMLGGSALFGYTVDDADTLPAKLQRQDPSLRVYNLGQMAYQIHDEVMVLADLLRQGYVPKMVVFYDGANEAGRGVPYTLKDNVTQPYQAGDYSHWTVRRYVEQAEQPGWWRAVNEMPLAKLAQRLKAKFVDHADFSGKTSELERHAIAAADNYLLNVRFARQLGHAYSFKVIFILQPIGVCLDEPQAYPYRFLGPPADWQLTYYRALYAAIDAKAGGSVVNWCRVLNKLVRDGSRPFNTMLHVDGGGMKSWLRRC